MPPLTVLDLRDWLLERALPLWLARGIDRASGGFHEFLSHDAYICDAPYRRLRVLTRQIIAFSQAHRHGLPGAAAAVAMGVDTLTRRAALPGGGYASHFNLAHTPLDTSPDLYDHAFVLLALAEAHLVLPAAGLHHRARALLQFLDAQMAHPEGGYREALPPRLPRRQNPHMHLLEALLAADRAFAEPIFLNHADTLVMLFTGRLLDEQSGALPEFFDESLHRQEFEGVFETEPGHLCEWAWLLQLYGKQRGDQARLSGVAARLLAFADEHGSHPVTGDLMDSLASNGTALARSARLWPQTERLKTAFLRPDRSAAHQRAACASLSAYLLPDGLWHERRDAAGAFVPGPSPASSLYHLTTGILTAAASSAD